MDTHSRRGDASPVHVHSRDDEAFLLLDGAMTIWVGEARHQLWPGGIAFLPRGIPLRRAAEQAGNTVIGPPHGLGG